MIINGKELMQQGILEPMHSGKISQGGVSFGLGEAGYDIRIKQDIHFYPNLGILPIVIVKDPLTGTRKITIGRFALASAVEQFSMPSRLIGVVHDKSTWARKGLSVFNTVIESGWKGYLTLELVFHGRWKPVHIRAFSGIAQVLFHEIKCPATYSGKYQNQPNQPQEAIESK